MSTYNIIHFTFEHTYGCDYVLLICRTNGGRLGRNVRGGPPIYGILLLVSNRKAESSAVGPEVRGVSEQHKSGINRGLRGSIGYWEEEP
jgi:hypothetical protein